MNRRPEAILSLALLILAALTVSSAAARTEDRSQRAEFRAGRSTENAGVVEFSRGFELTQGSLTITSDSARVFRDDSGALVRIEIMGTEADPARWREELDDGSSLDGRAERIDYFLLDEKVTLIGQALVRKAGDEMRAETINYDLNTQQLDAGGDSDEPVLFIYTPPQKPADG